MQATVGLRDPLFWTIEARAPTLEDNGCTPLAERLPAHSDEQVLLRRIPPSTQGFQTICDRGDGTFRAVSAVTSNCSDEEHLSCSRRRLTSPRQLLDDL